MRKKLTLREYLNKMAIFFAMQFKWKGDKMKIFEFRVEIEKNKPEVHCSDILSIFGSNFQTVASCDNGGMARTDKQTDNKH